MKLHVTEFQTVSKLIEYNLNNFPFSYYDGHSLKNSLILRFIFPNLLRLGRGELKIDGAYESFSE